MAAKTANIYVRKTMSDVEISTRHHVEQVIATDNNGQTETVRIAPK